MTVGAGELEGLASERRRWNPSVPRLLALLGAFLVSVGIGYTAYGRLSPAAPTTPLSLATVQRGAIAATISASGNVVATRQAKLAFVGGGRLQTINVKVGDTVKEGQPLAQLDTTDLQLKLEQAQSNLRSAQLKLDQLKAGARPEDIEAAKAAYDSAVAKLAEVTAGPSQADVAAAEQAVIAAQAALDKAIADQKTLTTPPSQDELASLKADLEKKRAALQQAQANYDKVAWRGDIASRPEALALQQATIDYQAAEAALRLKETPPTQEQLQAAQAAVDNARAQLQAAQAKLAQVKAGAQKSDIAAAQANVASAKAQLALKTASATAQDIGIAEEAVKQAEIAVKQANLDLQNATLTAPFAGIVAAVGANPGEQVGGGTAIVTLVDPSQFHIEVNVDESDIGRIAPGKSAIISVESLNQRFRGHVLAVAPSATVQQGVVTYLVTIGVDGTATLPAGMSVDVTIITDQKDNTLVVPSRAIRRQGRDQVVDVLVDGKPEPRVVQTGIVGDQQTEILSGLKEGDQVVLPTTTTATPGRITGGFGPGFGGGPGGGVIIRR